MNEDGIKPYGNKMIKHTKKITEVIDIRNPKYIVSCGLDGNICLWDAENSSKDNLMSIM